MADISINEAVRKELKGLPLSKAGELLDFIRFLKTQPETMLHMDEEEEKEVWDIIENDERYSLEEAEKMILGR